MNQLIAIAVGGSFGAVLRFFVANGFYQWLGRGFPYGTLAVNVIGSFLMGLLTEALILQRVAIATEYRAAILVGFLGSFTTFSTFSLETLYQLENGSFLKAGLNVFASVAACLLAVWIGLLVGRTLFLYSGGVIRWVGWIFPYAIVIVNAVCAFLIGLLTALLLQKSALTMEHRAAILVVLAGTFTTLSGLYLILYLIEEGHAFKTDMNLMMWVFLGNACVCIGAIWMGLAAGRQV